MMVSESSETYFDPSDADEIDRSALAGEVVEVCKTYGDPTATDDQARRVTLVTPVCVIREEQLTGLDCC